MLILKQTLSVVYRNKIKRFKSMQIKLFFLSVLLVSSCIHLKNEQIMTNINSEIDIQGHRGCRGLMPENSIPGFLKALELGVNTLELDLAVTKDSIVVISHEPWLSHEFCMDASGNRISKAEEESFNIFQMTYEELQNYDCGSLVHPRFKSQRKIKTSKPSFSEMIDSVKIYCKEKNIPLPKFNIEIKREPTYDGKFCPPVETFVDLVVKIIKDEKIEHLSNIQSFDFETLRICRKKYPDIPLALLKEKVISIRKDINILGFTPEIYSCNFKDVTREIVDEVHDFGMKMIPWTVNKKTDIRKMTILKVDGIISDYPDRVIEIIKKEH